MTDDSPIEDKVNYLLYNDINPGLASHGGVVSLADIDDGYAVLEFGGGCQGCSAVDLTLKEGVEKTLMEKIPELKGVRDVTDHTDTSNAYMWSVLSRCRVSAFQRLGLWLLVMVLQGQKLKNPADARFFMIGD